MSKERKSRNVSKLVVSLVALVAGVFQGTQAMAHSPAPAQTKQPDALDLNIASLASIESTWLQVPNVCKAKGFNAEPVSIPNQRISLEAQAIYAAAGIIANA